MPRNFHLGFFLKERHIEKAFTLLKKQLDQSSPLYNNLDFSLYRMEGLDKYSPQSFYQEYISQDSLFYFENLFNSLPYYSIQRAYKIREFHYLSLPSLITYYALGFYILELLQDRLESERQIYRTRNMNIYYGGKLHYDQPENSDIFYYADYKDFLHKKEAITTPDEGRITISISLDIKSFFYTIDHSVLLDIIDKKSTSINKNLLSYNEDTKRSIAVLLQFLQGSSVGLPVSSQNIISSLLSHIYLSELDKHISKRYTNTGLYQYLRYVDDFYLIFQDDKSIDDRTLRGKIYDIENDIAQYLMKDLKLSVSTEKSKRYKIIDISSQIDFLKSSNIDSPFDSEMEMEGIYDDSVLSIEIKGMSPAQVFEKCISIIAVMRSQTSRLEHINLDIKESAFLNYILLHKPCLQYSKSPAAITLMESFKIFEGLDSIDFLLIKPKVLLHLITVNETYRRRLFDFIKQSLCNSESILPKLTLIDKFFHQLLFLLSQAKEQEQDIMKTEFKEYQAALAEILQTLVTTDIQSNYMLLLERALAGEIMVNHFMPIYSSSFLNAGYSVAFTQQIKLRRLAEINKNYSVSFNHMLNEFQNLFEHTYFNHESKTALDITSKMNEQKFNLDSIAFVEDFFKRRNQNSISHTNDPEIGLWNVHYEEYIDYKQKVTPLIQALWHQIRHNTQV